MKNQKIRIAMMIHGIRGYEIARALGISETTWGRKIREELPEDEQERIVSCIENMEARNDV